MAGCSGAEQKNEPQQSADTVCINRQDLKLLIAAGTGDIQTMESALKAGANVNSSLEGLGMPIVAAAMSNNSRAVQLLLNHGANVNAMDAHGYTALVTAVLANDYATAQLLISKGADVNSPAQFVVNGKKSSMTPLFIAKEKGYEPMIKLLTDAGAK